MVNSINGVKFNAKHFEVLNSNNSDVVQIRHKKTGVVIDFNKNTQYQNAKLKHSPHTPNEIVLIGLATDDPNAKVNITGTDGNDTFYIKNSNLGNVNLGKGDDFVGLENTNVTNVDLGDGIDGAHLRNCTFENINVGTSIDENEYVDGVSLVNSTVAEGKEGKVTARTVHCVDNTDKPLENVTIDTKSAFFNTVRLKNSTINAKKVSLFNVKSENNQYAPTEKYSETSSIVSACYYATFTNDKIDSDKVRFAGYVEASGTEIRTKNIEVIKGTVFLDDTTVEKK